MALSCNCRIESPVESRVLERLAEHFAEHDAQIHREADRCEAHFSTGIAIVERDGAWLCARAEAGTLDDLAEIKEALASHILEFSAPDTPAIEWLGDADDRLHPPFFRVMTVRRAQWLSPRMRRLTLQGDNLARFASLHDLHVKLLLPPAGTVPLWPVTLPNGTTAWPEGPGRPAVRKYTIRRVDVGAGELDIDFVVHDHPGPGGRFGRHAEPGDAVGMIGPGGRSVSAADFHLLAGDETALPAIARILEFLPPDARGRAIIEVEDAEDQQAITAPRDFDIRWLHRRAGASLADDIEAVEPWSDARKVFVWGGCEFEAYRSLRRHFRRTHGLERDRHLIVPYWRRGTASG